MTVFFTYACSLFYLHVYFIYKCSLFTCVLYLQMFFIYKCSVIFIYIGDHLVLTSTDYNPDQAEEVTILEIVNNHQVRLTGNSHINIYFSCCISLLFFLFYYFLDL
jgi:hypothetical protein